MLALSLEAGNAAFWLLRRGELPLSQMPPGGHFIVAFVQVNHWLRIIAVLLFCASQAGAAVIAPDIVTSDPAAREVIAGHTLARDLKTVRLSGALKTTEWVMDRPVFAATLARHLHPALEPYHVTDAANGMFGIDDQGALGGNFRLVTRAAEHRVYVAEGEFHSLANMLKLSGSMVFTLTFREFRQGDESYVEVDTRLYLRLNNAVVRGIGKLVPALLNTIIDRRVARLAEAARIVSERLTKDPGGLYSEIHAWPDIRQEDLAEYRQAFHIASGNTREGG